MWINLENQDFLNILIASMRICSICVGLFYVFHLILGRRHTLGHSLLALMTLCSGIGMNILMTATLITAPYSYDMRILFNNIPISNMFMSLSICLTLLRYVSDSAFRINILFKAIIITFVFGSTLMLTVHAFQNSVNIIYLRTDYNIYAFMQASLSEWFLYVCVFIPQYIFVVICFLYLHIIKQQDENPATDVTCEICHIVDPYYFLIFIYIGIMVFILRPLCHYSTLSRFSSLIYSNEFLINPPFFAISFMFVCQVSRGNKASLKAKDLSIV